MISISTLAFSNQTLDTALFEIEKVCYRAEIFSEGLHDVICGNVDVDLSSYSLSYSLHAPLKNTNLASPIESARLSALNIIQKSASFCQKHDISILVVHPGFLEGGSTFLEAIAAYLKSLPILQKIKEEHGIRLCIENMPKTDLLLFQKPNEIDLTGLEFILDIGHAQTTGTLDEFLKMPVAHYHIHDNNGLTDSHLGFGDGVIGFSRLEQIVSKAKREKAILVAENKTIESALKTAGALKKASAHFFE
ncbi:MAG: sugar phosphate isomerase/epimerase [Methanimicrococcus sp.]|nr:sugar phosphate isomerase/epimerase [Methanimicrococcus sp.]